MDITPALWCNGEEIMTAKHKIRRKGNKNNYHIEEVGGWGTYTSHSCTIWTDMDTKLKIFTFSKKILRERANPYTCIVSQWACMLCCM